MRTFVLGIDLDEKRGGGTWIGVEKQGKISVLLNVLEENRPDQGKLSRGVCAMYRKIPHNLQLASHCLFTAR